MMWLAIFKFGFRNLMLHKLRSGLTILGTVLGVASVIGMLAIGEGSKRHAVEQIRQLGAANIIIRSVKPEADREEESGTLGSTQRQTSRVLEYGLLYKDYYRLLDALPTVKRGVPIMLVRKTAQHGRLRIPNARILGTTSHYRLVKNLSIRDGRFLTPMDQDRTANVAVLAAGAARRLFGFEDPLGKSLLIGSDAYRVVGVLRPQDGGARPGAATQDNLDNDIYIPLTAAQRRFGELQMVVSSGSRSYERIQLSEITLTVRDEELVSQTAAMARQLLLRSHPKGHDFEIQVPLELLEQAEREKRIWNLVLGSIAGISLVVGGIGIMNIMLATVTERTREIGIRRSLGARRRDIVMQFVVETTVLSTTGGVLGVLLGIAVPMVVGFVADMETAMSWWSVLLAFSISVLIGIIFGVYPARRAAMLDPIEALRHE